MPLRSNERWTDAMSCNFVTKYAEQECLWNTSNVFYCNRLAREMAIKEMVEAVNIPGFKTEEVKSKIRSLRSTYALEEAKIEKSYNNDEQPPYRPLMKWFYLLRPVMNIVKRNKMSLAAVPATETVQDGNSNSSEQQDTQPTQFKITTTLDDNPPVATPPAVAPEPMTSTEKSTAGPSGRKRRRQRSTKYELDECDIFGNYVSIQLKQISSEERLLAQNKIQSILHSARLKDLRSRSDSEESNISCDEFSDLFKVEMTDSPPANNEAIEVLEVIKDEPEDYDNNFVEN